ncbi:Hsp70 protein [Streptoalloteichus tenebrarius]|uniref:Hsp70 protein n=1 Tax=Streptoalloteichus tenebrarius (strain ATCC 17920 / DSM 40477 / JCM 4838 / CBS 697.72 / NBRC 16177 / NCIMB 11028 / NRRL B-12390 / A12253. 1 / ISP 5477) TaxID=1933 RepID=A0ABT1I3R8_STRSD|nr:Hsp70 family protein [Streptoalloteichus tenebrarius]MCP2262431.1 Hsp70 protein [Streptoalloteichus tenebrarius]BFF00790.1 Hsp70 family protein [Streptoalloteichus tenebrarius]
MPYVVGVDVGPARTTAAVCRLDGPPGAPRPVVRLGARAASVPTLLHLSPDGSALVGEDAEQLAPTHPTLVARGFPQRVGDPTPMIIGGEPYLPEVLTAVLVQWVVDQVAAREGAPARHVAVTHPAGWGAHRTRAVLRALREIGVPDVSLVPRPVAAAELHAVREPVSAGAALAVVAVNGDGVECAVARRTETASFDLVGGARALDGLGGDHLVDLLLDHVRGELGRALDDLDHDDPGVRLALSRLRADCALAVDALATRAEAVIPVRLPRAHTRVAVSRGLVEDLARPAWEHAADALSRDVLSTLDSRPPEAALLVGESARAPLVPGLVGAALRCRVVVDPDPATALARGAATVARWRVAGHPRRPAPPPPPLVERTTVLEPVDAAPVLLRPADEDRAEPTAPPPRPPVEVLPIDLPPRRTLRDRVPGLRSGVRPALLGRPGVLAAGVVALLVAGVALTFTFQGDATPAPGADPGQATSSPDAAPSAPAVLNPPTRTPSSKPQPAKDGR